MGRGRELGLGGDEEEKRGKRTLKVSRKGRSGVGNGDGDGEQGRLILPGKEGQDGEAKVQEEHKEEVQEEEQGVRMEVEEMKAPAPQMPIALTLIPLALSLATASASATSPGTRSAGVWVILSVGEGEARLEKEQKVVMTSGHVDLMQIVLQRIQLALSLVTASVSATPPAWGSAGARGPPSVGAEVEEWVEEGVEEEELLVEAEVVELLQEVEGVEV